MWPLALKFCTHIACVAGPQFYGGPDLQRAGFWRARGRIEGLQESLPFMTTRPSHNIINGFLKLTNKNSAAIGENPGERNIFACIKTCQSNNVANCSGKVVHVSSQNLFKPSQRKQSFGIVLSDG
jgi:hypothetical protein